MKLTLAMMLACTALLTDCTAGPPPTASTSPSATSAASTPSVARVATAAVGAATSASATTTHTTDTAVATAIPADAAGIWKAIDDQQDRLRAIVANGDLKQVHHVAFAIRDLVAALPAQGRALPAAEQAKLVNSAKFVATLADRLDASGDGDDRAGAQANFAKLEAILNDLPRGK